MQIVVNGQPQDAPEGATLLALIERLKLGGRRIAVERNGEIVPRSAHAATALVSGDRVEIIHAVGGG